MAFSAKEPQVAVLIAPAELLCYDVISLLARYHTTGMQAERVRA